MTWSDEACRLGIRATVGSTSIFMKCTAIRYSTLACHDSIALRDAPQMTPSVISPWHFTIASVSGVFRYWLVSKDTTIVGGYHRQDATPSGHERLANMGFAELRGRWRSVCCVWTIFQSKAVVQAANDSSTVLLTSVKAMKSLSSSSCPEEDTCESPTSC